MVSVPIDMKEAIELASSISRDKGTRIMVMEAYTWLEIVLKLYTQGMGILTQSFRYMPVTIHHASKRRLYTVLT